MEKTFHVSSVIEALTWKGDIGNSGATSLFTFAVTHLKLRLTIYKFFRTQVKPLVLLCRNPYPLDG